MNICCRKILLLISMLLAAAFSLSGQASASQLPGTGQTKCYNDGDEISCPAPGEPFYGQDAHYPRPRSYTKLGMDGVVLADSAIRADGWLMTRDNVTGLTWEVKTGDGGIHDQEKTYTWCDRNPDTNGGSQGTCGPGTGDAATDTEAFIKALNDNRFGGFSDWRLPTVRELSSLVNSGIATPGPTINTPWFPNTVSSRHWSSTTYLGVYWTNDAWHVDFSGGDVGAQTKTQSYPVLAVRGGQSGPPEPWINNGDGTVTDPNTGLMWQEATAPGTYTWEEALDYCEKLSLAEHTDWRLPDRNELQSLADYSRWEPAVVPILAGKTVFGWEDTPYWSSTTSLAYQPFYAWFVDFLGGSVDHNEKGFDYYVRAVRSSDSGPPAGSVILRGLVVERDIQGNPLSPLSGVDIQVSGIGASTTGSNGEFSFEYFSPGTYTVSVGKEGYYPASREITLNPGDTRHEVLYLLTAQQADDPGVFDFQSPRGKHFIEGTPGDLSFEATIAWNGGEGSVRFRVAGQWVDAQIIDLGGGLARAVVSVPAPAALDSCSELAIEVTNGAGKTTTTHMGVHFSPVSGVIPWYKDNIPWTPSGASLSYTDGFSWHWELPAIGPMELEASLGYSRTIRYDLLAATLRGSLKGQGTLGFDFPTPQPGLKVLGEGTLGIEGALAVSMAGCAPPLVTPSWSLFFEGRSGLEAPVVLAVDAVAPPLGSTLASIPIIRGIKLRLYLLWGGGLTGAYEGVSTGNCLFGSTSLSGLVMGGLEAQALVDLTRRTKAGVYLGGTGTFNIGICPDFVFNSYTGRIYAGAFAQSFGFRVRKEVGAEIEWDFNRKPMARAMSIADLTEPALARWQPIGSEPLKWGDVNRLVADRPVRRPFSQTLEQTGGAAEERLVENVIGLAGPAVFADDSESIILFALHDTEKPWYAATDIAKVTRKGHFPWAMERITDNGSAEFTPQLTKIDADTLLTVWTRVKGDVSEAESPEDIAPHLEIVSSRYDRGGGQWSEPEQLTTNDVVDRDPTPTLFGHTQGVLWIQNQGDAMLGDATKGDRLVFRAWTGSTWDEPTLLWSDDSKGIVDYAFVEDSRGEGHLVFLVDRDGDPETVEDRELYRLSTQAGLWQEAERLTDDTVEDALPVLIAPQGEPMLVWKADETLMYTWVLTWSPKPVYEKYTPATEAPTLDGVTLPGGAAIAYSVQAPEGIDIVAAFYDADLDQWSLPRQLTRDAHAESSLAMAFDGTELVIAYLKTETLREDMKIELGGQLHLVEDVPQPGRTDLYVLRHTLGHDLAVAAGSLALSPANPAPGTRADITATIDNRGDRPAQNVLVAFYDGDPDAGGGPIGQTTITGPLVAGGSADVTVPWDLPAAPGPRRLFVVADPLLSIDDRDRTNNMAVKGVSLPDLAIETAWSDPVSKSAVALTARVINDGVVPSGSFDVSWRLYTADGEEIGRTTVASLNAGSSHEAAFLWEVQTPIQPGHSVPIHVVADPDKAILEFDEFNNTTFHSVRTPLYTDQVGSLEVQINPPAAVAAGVLWSIDGGRTWHESGDSLTLLSGDYTIVFNEASGWHTPAGLSATIQTVDTATASGDYIIRIDADWLKRCGFPADGSADFIDSDGDGFSNWEEWRAGSDPSSKSSRPLRIIRADQVTTHEADDRDPAWSPSGGAIAFASNRNGHYDLFVITPDGADLVQLTGVEGADERYPAWNSDGSKIAYIQYDPAAGEGGYFLCTINADGTDRAIWPLSELLAGESPPDYWRSEIWSPAWSPDDTAITFISRGPEGGSDKIYAYDLGTKNITEITPVNDPNPTGMIERLSWSRAHGLIAYDRWLAGIQKFEPGEPAAAFIPGNMQDPEGFFPVMPDWDREGSRLGFAVKGVKTKNVAVFDAHDGITTFIRSSSSESWPSWAPDGKKIAFVREVSGLGDIWIYSVVREIGLEHVISVLRFHTRGPVDDLILDMDDVDGDGRIGLTEAIFIMQKLADMR